MATLNLLEAILTEKKNYIESEEYITKSIIFGMFLSGDPRGRNSLGNFFLLFPLWKISRQTLILENSLISENFKEMFHCQDFIFKNKVENLNGNYNNNNNYNNDTINDLFDPKLQYYIDNMLRRKYEMDKKAATKKNTKKNNFNNLLDSSDILLDENKTFAFEDDTKIFNLLEENFQKSTKFKYFNFPNISDTRNSCSNYFISENFVNFLFKNLTFLNEGDLFYDEEILNKIGLNSFSILSNIDNDNDNDNHNLIGSLNNLNESNRNNNFYQNQNQKTKSYSLTNSVSSKRSKGIGKNSTLSQNLYEILLDKMCFKKNLPYGVVVSWGNNMHLETGHNVNKIF